MPLFIVVVAFGLCLEFNQDKEQKKPEAIEKEHLLGSWVFEGPRAVTEAGHKIVLSFYSDGTYSDVVGCKDGVFAEKGQWTLDGNTLVLKAEGLRRHHDQERRLPVSQLTERTLVYRAQRRNEGTDSDWRFERAGKKGMFLFLEKTKSNPEQSKMFTQNLIGDWTWNDTIGIYTMNGNRAVNTYLDDGKYRSTEINSNGKVSVEGTFRVEGNLLVVVEKNYSVAELHIIKRVTKAQIYFVMPDGVEHSYLRGANAKIIVKRKCPPNEQKVQVKDLAGAWVNGRLGEENYWHIEFKTDGTMSQRVKGGGKPVVSQGKFRIDENKLFLPNPLDDTKIDEYCIVSVTESVLTVESFGIRVEFKKTAALHK